jgi:hypothetical protein
MQHHANKITFTNSAFIMNLIHCWCIFYDTRTNPTVWRVTKVNKNTTRAQYEVELSGIDKMCYSACSTWIWLSMSISNNAQADKSPLKSCSSHISVLYIVPSHTLETRFMQTTDKFGELRIVELGKICEILGSHGSEYEDGCLLGCCAV